ncbi:NAD(P)-binding domain-containing protein [Fulvivirga maritima]|uniref:NAD(P)-binding domain-containing protein n=1 Tax=Fulvivirga maritima TaxID=2904247 RepID=UPI001F3ED609|nr:NAD(P)-binding domain-containing protein [Fulvivirga maritima]UII24656.1 NAD(P)-binding domain-containing protein [Fulvivirga maritima]
MKKHYDYIILGAGPAGLQLGYFMEHSSADYLILERGEAPGTAFKKFPRHGTLISINKVHTGYDNHEIKLRWDWNSLLSKNEDLTFRRYSKEYFPKAKDLVEYLKDYAKDANLNVAYNKMIAKISKALESSEGNFELKTTDGDSFYCNKIIIATGFSQPYLPSIPGIEHTDNYIDVTLDKKEFENKKVLVLGKGNSGFETADYLIDTASLIHISSPNSVKFAWQTHYVGNLRAINNNFLDTYQLKSQNALLDADIQAIVMKDGKYNVHLVYAHANGEEEVLEYDKVIVCTGFKLDKSIFAPNCMPATVINDKLPALNLDWESQNIPHMYFAGTLMQSNAYKKNTSGFIHGFRYNVRTLFHILQYKYNHMPMPSKNLECNYQSVAEEILNRINSSSALWQQFGYLFDLVSIGDEDATYFYELPKGYKPVENPNHYFTISLEFGSSQENVFMVNRNPTADKADESFFLHPVIRHYCGDEMISCLHLVEDLLGEWKHEDKHVMVLKKYVEAAMEKVNADAIMN